MTAASQATLWGTLLLLGLMPTTSSWVVAARSSMWGRGHGVLAAAGVVTGDIAFVTVAVLGLASLADALGAHRGRGKSSFTPTSEDIMVLYQARQERRSTS